MRNRYDTSWQRRLVLPAVTLAILAALIASPTTSGHPTWKHAEPLRAPLLHEIDWHRSGTQQLRRDMGLPRFPVAHAERRTTSVAFRTWIRDLWRTRHQEARNQWREYFASWEALENDWHRALSSAAARFGVSYSWLHACNHGEGGHNRYADNPISDATGTMQFMPGTFYGNAPAAFRAAHVPARYMNIFSFVGQAYTAAYMFSIGQSRQWVGAGC